MRDLFEPSDRFLTEDILILIGNHLINRETSEFKFDYKLFPFLTRFNFAYKYYLDEALSSMKNLSKSLINSYKKAN